MHKEVIMDTENPQSTARVLGHPIHPLLVTFPITFLVATLVTDVTYWQTGNFFWAEVSFWSLGAGIATALLAGLAGAIDFISEPRIRSLKTAWLHMIGNAAAIGVAFTNLMIRMDDHQGTVLSLGLTLSIAVVVILAFTGWWGGELVFRHGVAVKPVPNHLHKS
jgi:uncharacterized membrane protein